jgi:hypothetical protein
MVHGNASISKMVTEFETFQARQEVYRIRRSMALKKLNFSFMSLSRFPRGEGS